METKKVEESQEELNRLLDMKIHEIIKFRDNIWVLKVCGGWIYDIYNKNNTVYVPNPHIPRQIEINGMDGIASILHRMANDY